MNKILVVDFGSQYNQLIVRRLREANVYSELISFTTPLEDIKKIKNLKGLILSGGPDVASDETSMKCDPKYFELGIPILGICYGMQYMSLVHNQKLIKTKTQEFGEQNIKVINSLLTKDIPEINTVWMSHGYHVELTDDTFIPLGYSDSNQLTAFKHKELDLYGLQFHPEVTHSTYGKQYIQNFINICECEQNYTMNNFVDDYASKIKEIVGNKKILCGLSGGVDSTVVALFLHKLFPNQVFNIFVDHGLLRKNEGNLVLESLESLGLNIKKVDAKRLFLDELKDVDVPEEKRKIIGKLFIDVFKEEALKIEDITFLAQGTLYTDIIESGTATAQTIKSHHNVGGLPEQLGFELIEPLKTLFKDEVRTLGKVLGLKESIVNRQPFPGPGIAIRIIGAVTEEKIKIVQDSDFILHEIIKKHNLNTQIWQYFTVLTNTSSVGVKGDERSYEHVLAIRAVTSIDGMSADFYPFDMSILKEISSTITNNVKGINRVVYDVTSKPPSTIEWE